MFPQWLIGQISASATAVFLAMMTTWRPNNPFCWYSKATIAQKAGVSDTTVLKAWRELEHIRAIKYVKTRKKTGTKQFQINLEKPAGFVPRFRMPKRIDPKKMRTEEWSTMKSATARMMLDEFRLSVAEWHSEVEEERRRDRQD